MKARVANVPGCEVLGTHPTLFDTMFGFDFVNVLRILDPDDNALDDAYATTWPTTCNISQFAFNWKNIRDDFIRVNLPDTCKASKYLSEGCKFHWKLLPGFDIEVSIREGCKDVTQLGYHLPQFEVRCNGVNCSSLGKPCTVDTHCAGGLKCDAVPDAFLDSASTFLTDIGLFNESFDGLPCTASGFTFTEQFFSKIINEAAEFIGLADKVESFQWNQLHLCGIQTFADQYIPTTAPTPAPSFKCIDGSLILPNQVCDNITDCGSGEDEQNCNCGVGFQFDSFVNRCCAPCSDEIDCESSYMNDARCGYDRSSSSAGGLTFCDADPVTSVWSCPALERSLYEPAIVAPPPFKSVKNTGDSRIIGWSDCDGSFQIGNIDDLGVLNAFIPIHEVATRLERVIASTQQCRAGANVDVQFLKRQFYAWGVSFLGGAFFHDLWPVTEYNGHTPGSNFDRDFRWYAFAQEENSTTHQYLKNPPMANLGNAPKTCDGTTVYAASPKCELNAEIQEWFTGSGFPAAWSKGGTTLQFYVESKCLGNSFPQASLVCTGKCGPDGESGCCLMSKPFVMTPPTGCPGGYTRSTIESNITDFLFENASAATTRDTTLINFLQLVSTQQFDFANVIPGAPEFVRVDLGTAATICMINGSTFDQNVEAWANKTFTETCADGITRDCPAFLSDGGIKACGANSVSCVGEVPSVPCPATGCPAVSGTSLLFPALGIVLPLALLLPS